MLWVLSLARRPAPGDMGEVLGYHGLYRGDYDSKLVYIDADGVTENDRLVTFAEMDAALAEGTAGADS